MSSEKKKNGLNDCLFVKSSGCIGNSFSNSFVLHFHLKRIPLPTTPLIPKTLLLYFNWIMLLPTWAVEHLNFLCIVHRLRILKYKAHADEQIKCYRIVVQPTFTTTTLHIDQTILLFLCFLFVFQFSHSPSPFDSTRNCFFFFVCSFYKTISVFL